MVRERKSKGRTVGQSRGRASEKSVEGSVSGAGAAAAISGKGDALAEGETVLALARTGKAVAKSHARDQEIEELRRAIEQLGSEMQTSVEACLRVLDKRAKTDGELLKMKDSVDDLWAAHAAASMKSSLLAPMGKQLVGVAIKLGVAALGAVLSSPKA